MTGMRSILALSASRMDRALPLSGGAGTRKKWGFLHVTCSSDIAALQGQVGRLCRFVLRRCFSIGILDSFNQASALCDGGAPGGILSVMAMRHQLSGNFHVADNS